MALVDFDYDNFMKDLTPKEKAAYKRMQNEIIRRHEISKPLYNTSKYHGGLIKRKEFDKVIAKVVENMKDIG